jgi:hypothetical protein
MIAALAWKGLILGGLGAAAGLLALWNGPLLYPTLTLLLGVVCGVTVFSGGHAAGAPRLLGGRRFSPDGAWLLKVGVGLAMAAAVALLVLLPTTVRALYFSGRPRPDGPRSYLVWLFGDALLGELAPPGVFLALGLLHGFAIGVLCGMLCRRPLVAGILATGMSLVAAGIWLPSLVGAGLHFWQIAGVPLLALAATRLCLPAWVVGRIGPRARARALAGFAGASALWLLAALGMRVLEVPDRPVGFNLPDFVASLPPPGQDEAGDLTRWALEGMRARQDDLGIVRRTRLPMPDEPDARVNVFPHQCEEVLRLGWQAGDVELAEWLGRLFDAPWPGKLARAAGLPPGVVEDPRRLTLTSLVISPSRMAGPAWAATNYLSAHGLWQQACGDPAAFPADLRAGLALVRNLRRDTLRDVVFVARRAEVQWFGAIDLWLEGLAGRPELLRQVLQLLRLHEAETAAPIRSGPAEFLVLQNTLDRPDDWLPEALTDTHAERSTAAAVAVAWRAPWEQARRRRLLRLTFPEEGSARPRAEALAPWARRLPPAVRVTDESGQPPSPLTRLRVAALAVALRLYLAEKGRPAPTLEALVPDYLPAVPLDPFDARPFRYRLSAGERIESRRRPPHFRAARFVPAGRGILWSPGGNLRDGGGKRFGADAIFVVPPEPHKGGGP